MAKMFPKQPLFDTQSNAEKILFKELEHQLSDDYYVFHAVSWQVPNTEKGVQDGEADFLIIHADLGILIIEVKGGQIRYDGSIGQWYSNKNEIRDPLKQGRNAKYAILAKLREKFRRWININHCVAFPDIIVTDDLRLDGPKELTIDSENINDLNTWLSNAMNYIHGTSSFRNIPFTTQDIEFLRNIFAPSREFQKSIQSYFKQQEQTIKELTEQQFGIINYLIHHKRVAISGCAGSGKTLVAVEKAIRLAKDGFKTLLLCHNPYLAEYLQKLTDNTVEVMDFNSWSKWLLGDMIDQSKIVWTHHNEPTNQEIDSMFDELLQIGGIYDAIIVDEGQDFRDTWWLLIESALKNQEDGILYIFYDDHQMLHPLGSLKYPIEHAPYLLSKNCRNTGEIFEIVAHLHPQAPEPSPHLLETGIVKYKITGINTDIIPVFKDAVLESLQYLSYKRLVVLTTESDVEKSQLNGITISTNSINHDHALQGWQQFVCQHIERALCSLYISMDKEPLNISDLSSSLYPTSDDVEKISDFLNRFGREQYLPPYSIGMHGQASKLFVQNNRLVLSDETPARVLRLFANKSWVKHLPVLEPHIRIITVSEYKNSVSKPARPIFLYNVASYKGLESDGVIFYFDKIENEVYDESFLVKSLYVGVSRSKHFLYFIGPFDVHKPVDEIIRLYSDVLVSK